MNARTFAILWAGSLASVLATAAAPGGSCLVPSQAIGSIDGLAQAQDADGRLSVLRPCVGKVRPQVQAPVEVLIGTTGGSHQRLRVRGGESLQERVATAIGPGNQLADIWPGGSILDALGGWMTGKPRRISGVSGFDGDGKTLPLTGDLAALPGTVLPLAPFGWAPDQPVTFSQRGKSFSVAPVGGGVALPLARLSPGELTLSQAGRPPAVLNLLADADLADLRKALKAIDGQGLAPAERAVLRAAVLQQEQLLVNAVAEHLKGRQP